MQSNKFLLKYIVGKQMTSNTFLFNQIVQNDHETESYIYFVMRKSALFQSKQFIKINNLDSEYSSSSLNQI